MKIRNLWKVCIALGLGATLALGGGTAKAAERPAVKAAESGTQDRSAAQRSYTEGEEDVYELKLTGAELPLSVSKTASPGIRMCFEITAEESGWYSFEGSGSEEYFAEIRDAEDKSINSDWGFQMDAELQAGSVYYLYVEPDEYAEEEDSFTLTVKKPAFVVAEDEQSVTFLLDETDEPRISVDIIQLDDSVQLSYQWYQWDEETYEYVEIPGATERVYFIDELRPDTEFVCKVSDGEITKEAYVYVYIDSGLALDSGEEDIQVKPGETATLKVNVTNPSGNNLKFSWYREVNVDGVISDEELENVTGDTLVLENVLESRVYSCKVSDGYMSQVMYFYVNVDSGFTVDAESVHTVHPGEDVELSVTASVEHGALSYKWYRLNLDTEEYELIDGATADHYMCKDIQKAQEYKCRVADSYQNTETIFFQINLQTDLYVEAEDSYQVKPGESVTLEVTARSSYGELTYQWYDSDDEPIEGAVSNSYTIDKVTKSETYTCEVRDDYCRLSKLFWVKVDSGFEISYDYDQTIKYGTGTLNLSVDAVTEVGQLTYQWYDENDEPIPGAEESSYQVTNVTSERSYYCLVQDGYNSHRATFYITVDTGLQVSGGGDIYVDLGKDTILQIDASTEIGELTYEWYKGEEEEDKYFEEVTGNQFKVKNVDSYQYYYCRVSDGVNTRDVMFYVYVDSGFQVDARSLYLADEGDKITLTVNAQTDYGPLKCEWLNFDYDAGRYEVIAEGLEYPVTVSDGCREYYCRVSDAYNSKEFGISVMVSHLLEGSLKEGENKLSAPKEWEMHYIPFVPKKTGTYKFCSAAGKSTCGYLLDSGLQPLAQEFGDLWSVRNGGGGIRDFTIEYPLKAGVTYYLGVFYQMPEDAGMMTVNVSCLSEKFECTHPYLTDWIVTQESTCTHGKKREKRCTVCGEVRLGEEYAIQIRHPFGDWTVVTAATAEREGLESRTCTMCGRKETRRTAKLSATVKMKADNLPLKVKQSFNLVKALERAEGDTVVSWSSTNPKVAAVNKKGKVVGKKKGTATITVKMKSGATASVKVKVQKNVVKTKKVKVSKKKITLKKGKSQQIKTEITPLTSQDKVKYSSSNKKVAVVSAKGKITAKKPGKAKITVRSGKKKTVIKVTVK